MNRFGTDEFFLSGFTRRAFVKTLALLGISQAALPDSILKLLTANSRVIIVSDTTATSGSTINTATVQIMIDSGIKSLAQVDDVGEAWKVLLPGATAASRIGIKVNCINSSLSSHPQVANAIAVSLQKMNFGGTFLPANNIIIFDRTRSELQGAGYTLNTSTTGVRCIGTDGSGIGYSTANYSISGVTQKISNVVVNMIDYMINLAVLKNHSISGVTCCMKNHYGTCNNPGNLHNNACNPYIPALNACDPIKSKQKVCIIDALYGIRSGGPGGSPQFTANKFIMSTDIVATDYQGRKLLQENGCTTTSTATYIDVAATTYGLGTNDPTKMDIVNVVNPSAKTVSVLSPNGGENWVAGSSHTIKWNSANIGTVKLEASYDGGTNWSVIIASVTASAGQYEWIVPNNPSTNCKVRISDTTAATVKDESDTVFTISLPRAVSVLAPNGGEVWVADTKQQIRWSMVNVADVVIDYSIDNGTTWLPVIATTPAGTGSYNWQIPNTPSAQCLVRVSDLIDRRLSDISDAVFTINPISSVENDNTLPTDYELLQNYPNPFNASTAITFKTPADGAVKLELLDTRGRSIRTILNQWHAKGTHSAAVNLSSETSGIYFIRMTAGKIIKTIKISLMK